MKKQVGSILIALITVISLQGTLFAQNNVCEFIFKGCPKDFSGDTITLPDNVVALSSSILSCVDSLQYSVADSSPPPSIMFVIDHSASMGGNANANDAAGSRFTVTKDFVDSIYAKQPKAEVGLVIFAGHLYLDKTTGQDFTQYFKTLPAGIDDTMPNQAYLEMLTLDSTYGTKKGIDIIKEVLTTKDTTGTTGGAYTDLAYQPTYTRIGSGTNINLAFITAKEAMKSAKNPKERQFLIFFSDGEATATIPSIKNQNDYQNGVDVPTTFTVYFTSRNTVPQSIQTMTNNIKKNYPNSGAWALQTNHQALLDLLMNTAFKNIVVHGNPSHMVINGITSTGATDTSFEFPKDFALTGDITPFSAEIKYQYKNPDNTTKDTTVNLSFVVKRKKNSSVPGGIGTYCWEQPTLQFYYNNSPISEATEDMQQLQIRLTPNEETVINPQIVLQSKLENMTIALSSVNAGAYWEKSFPRATSTTPINDNILQHIAGDSIIAVYHNPDLPLDSIRVAIHVKIHPNAIPVTAILRDTSADGHYDRIDLVWDTTIDIIKILPVVSQLVSNAQIITTADGTVKLNPGMLVKKNGDTLSIILIENTGKNRETGGWTSADVKLTDTVMTVQGNTLTVVKVIDGAGPVLVRAIYYPGNGSDHDTLKVLFSEPVNCATLQTGTPEGTYRYIDAGKQNQEILTGATYFPLNCQSGFVTEVNISLALKYKGLVIPGEDSMSLFPNNSYVADKDNNRPPTNNRSVPIEWGIDNLISIGVATNPSVVGVTEIKEKVRQYYGITEKEKKGAVIGITSLKPLIKLDDGSYGSAVIYDAVGNLIMEKVPIKIAVSQNNPNTAEPGKDTGIHYYVYWDWKNRHNRTVGTGTYLFVLSSKTTDNKTLSKRMKVGVVAEN